MFSVLQTKFILAFGLIYGYLLFIFFACLLGNFIEMTVCSQLIIFRKFFVRLIFGIILTAWSNLRCFFGFEVERMPLSEQKMYKFIIQRCQNPTLLTVGGFYPLNLDTCLEVCKYGIDIQKQYRKKWKNFILNLSSSYRFSPGFTIHQPLFTLWLDGNESIK